MFRHLSAVVRLIKCTEEKNVIWDNGAAHSIGRRFRKYTEPWPEDGRAETSAELKGVTTNLTVNTPRLSYEDQLTL
jgi:hypothetical protein